MVLDTRSLPCGELPVLVHGRSEKTASILRTEESPSWATSRPVNPSSTSQKQWTPLAPSPWRSREKKNLWDPRTFSTNAFHVRRALLPPRSKIHFEFQRESCTGQRKKRGLEDWQLAAQGDEFKHRRGRFGRKATRREEGEWNACRAVKLKHQASCRHHRDAHSAVFNTDDGNNGAGAGRVGSWGWGAELGPVGPCGAALSFGSFRPWVSHMWLDERRGLSTTCSYHHQLWMEVVHFTCTTCHFLFPTLAAVMCHLSIEVNFPSPSISIFTYCLSV